MGLIFWWMLLVWIAAAAAYLVFRYLLHKKKLEKNTKRIPIAHSDRLTNLAEYKRALKRYQQLLQATAAVFTIAVVVACVITARPAAVTYIAPAQKGRDVMLCLDVSGSLLRVDSVLINRFLALVKNFEGQRFGLTVFNSSAIGLVPLNNDQDFTVKELSKVGKALSVQKGQVFKDVTSGTLADFDSGTSLVSDGIVSCLNNLGKNELDRSQSIILATDNDVQGKPIISMKQANELAKERGVHIYIVDPGKASASRTKARTELIHMSVETGGRYTQLSEQTAVSDIINDMSKQEAKYAESPPTVAVNDVAGPFVYILVLCAGAGFVLAWRLRL